MRNYQEKATHSVNQSDRGRGVASVKTTLQRHRCARPIALEPLWTPPSSVFGGAGERGSSPSSARQRSFKTRMRPPAYSFVNIWL
ncbi:hypothetical protein AOLI_G00084330 [Acnodon oligacanthus]